MAAPIMEEGCGLSGRKRKHRVLEPGALVIEHAEPSDTGGCERQVGHMTAVLVSLTVSSLRCVHLRGVEHGGS